MVAGHHAGIESEGECRNEGGSPVGQRLVEFRIRTSRRRTASRWTWWFGSFRFCPGEAVCVQRLRGFGMGGGELRYRIDVRERGEIVDQGRSTRTTKEGGPSLTNEPPIRAVGQA